MSSAKGKAPALAGDEASVKTTHAMKQKELSMSDSTEIQVSSQPIFNFGEHSVRVIVREGSPWFVAKDVCEALDYSNPSDAVATHLDKDERMTIANGESHSGQRGGSRLMTIISESGLYALVLRSRKPVARQFAKWVTSEVLPAIRKTGSYQQPIATTPYSVAPGQTLSAEQADALRDLLSTFAESMPKDLRAQIMIQGWSKLKAHFKSDYRRISAGQFTEAVSILGRHIAHWAPADPKKTLLGLPAPATDQAPSLKNRRWLVSFDHTGREIVQAVPMDALVVTAAELPKLILHGDTFTGREAFDIASHANLRMMSETTRIGTVSDLEPLIETVRSLPSHELTKLSRDAWMELSLRTVSGGPLRGVH